MPLLKLADPVELNWEETGEGPLVILAMQFFSFAGLFKDLIADLAVDHRVVTYDIRGTGASTRSGPYDVDTDAADLAALSEMLGGSAVVVGWGDGCNRAVKVAADAPHLVAGIVTPGGNPVGLEASRGTDALVDSPAVLEALVGMIETDYRAALRTMISGANPQLSEEEARERVDRVVEHCPQEVGAARLRAWIDDRAVEAARAAGDRLWILSNAREDNPWFTPPALDRTRDFLPDAHIEEVEGGALSRPDLTAAVVRRISASLPTGEQATIR
jgi:pimeloyl-ACP methyl ester carboxylesterase